MSVNKDGQYYECLGRYVELKEEAERLASERDALLRRLGDQLRITLEAKANGNVACEFDVGGARTLLESAAQLNERLTETVAASKVYTPVCQKPELRLQPLGTH
jgi:hypothetical protein